MDEIKETKKYLMNLFKQDLKKGKKPVLYTTVKHVSNSGMMRHIDVIYIKNNEPIKLNWYIEKIGLYKRGNAQAKNCDSLRVSGCGMDMGFDVVYTLGCALKELANYGIVTGRNGDKKPETNTGYLLKQEWL